MIKLTDLNGEPFLLNADLIRYVEARPDTFVTMVGGERIVVRETMDQVLAKALEYQRAKQLIPHATRRMVLLERNAIHAAVAFGITAAIRMVCPRIAPALLGRAQRVASQAEESS